MPPSDLGPDGEGVFELRPGAWTAFAEVKGLGTALQALTVEPGAIVPPVELVVGESRAVMTGTAIELDEKVQFDLDAATLRPEAAAILDEVARAVLGSPHVVKIEIQGHTDDTGGLEYNLELSQRRAETVRQALIDRGVAPERLVARGYGVLRPVTPNVDDASRARNRRVEFVILEGR